MTDSVRRARHALLFGLALLLGATAFSACGDDEEPDPISETIDVRNGYWRVATTQTRTGTDPSCGDESGSVDTLLFCDFDPASGFGAGSFRPVCDFTEEGDAAFTFTCDGEIEYPPCVLEYRQSGEGVYTDTTLEYTSRTTLLLAEDLPICIDAGYADPCTTVAVVTASWIGPDTLDVCDDAAAPARLPGLLGRIAAPIVPVKR